MRFAWVMALMMCTVSLAEVTQGEVTQQPIFVSGQQGYHTFRIPSLITTAKGTVLAFCEGRKSGRSDHGDIDLVLKRSVDNGATWSDLEIVHEEGGGAQVTIGNPCPVIDQATGKIWLTLCRDNKRVLVTHSDDDGKTWARPVDISAAVTRPEWTWVATGPGVGIQLTKGPQRGRLVIPCDHGQPLEGRRVMFSHVFYSDDAGHSWQLGGSLDKHTDECQVVQRQDGSLLMNARSYWGTSGKRPDRANQRALSVSQDGGATWSELTFDQQLVEPVCQASLLRYDDTRLIFSNPAAKSRRRMTVRVSSDDGRTWPRQTVLHAGPAAYSCLSVLHDGSIGCLYEGGDKTAYEKLIFARMQISDITAAP